MKTQTLRNYEIVDILNTLYAPDSILNSRDSDKKLPVSVLWKINGNVKTLKAIQERIVEEEQKINNEYFNDEKSQPNEQGTMEVKPEYREEFLAKKNDLLNIENEVDISMIKLNDISSLSFIPSDFMAISFMITDEEE